MSSEEQRTESAADVDETADVEPVDDERSADTAEDGSAEAGPNADGQQGAEKAARNETLMRRLVFGSAALAAASVIAAALFGVLWWIAAADDDADLAQTREEIVRIGSSAVQAFTELDYTKPDEYFDRSAAAATGELAQQINAGREANKKAMVEAKTTASTKVLDLAVSELNEHEGRASFLAAIQVEVKQGEKSSVKLMRVEVQMTRVEEDGEQTWKVSAISQVPVVGAAQ